MGELVGAEIAKERRVMRGRRFIFGGFEREIWIGRGVYREVSHAITVKGAKRRKKGTMKDLYAYQRTDDLYFTPT